MRGTHTRNADLGFEIRGLSYAHRNNSGMSRPEKPLASFAVLSVFARNAFRDVPLGDRACHSRLSPPKHESRDTNHGLSTIITQAGLRPNQSPNPPQTTRRPHVRIRSVTPLTSEKLDILRDLSPSELALLRTVKERGAALEEDLALKLDRLGDDLKPEIEDLRKRKLLNVRSVEQDGEKTDVLLASPDIRDLL